jgi:hypothetical protein
MGRLKIGTGEIKMQKGKQICSTNNHPDQKHITYTEMEGGRWKIK